MISVLFFFVFATEVTKYTLALTCIPCDSAALANCPALGICKGKKRFRIYSLGIKENMFL